MYEVEHIEKTYRAEELVPGFIGRSCSFEYKPYERLGKAGQLRFDRLRQHLLQHGMIDPLITHKGCVLIGMRRFAILRNTQEEFKCLEVTEDVATWIGKDITRFQNWKTQVNQGPAC